MGQNCSSVVHLEGPVCGRRRGYATNQAPHSSNSHSSKRGSEGRQVNPLYLRGGEMAAGESAKDGSSRGHHPLYLTMERENQMGA